MPSTLEGARQVERSGGPYASWRAAMDRQFEAAPDDWQARWLQDKAYVVSESSAVDRFFVPGEFLPQEGAREPLGWAADAIIGLTALLWLVGIVQFARWQGWI